ncbi:hypothetical protein Hanom_Chr14g01304991 [Helianthus anomalus]
MLQTTLSFKNLVQEIGNRKPDNPNLETGHSGPANPLPEPVVFVSPRPVSELNAAATTVQKIYKSYRTRRNLADCAVVVEELWSVSMLPMVCHFVTRIVPRVNVGGLSE